MNEMNDLPHKFADNCVHAGMDKACPSCRRAFDVVASKAWDEGYASTGIMLPTMPPQPPRNPYREDEDDE